MSKKPLSSKIRRLSVDTESRSRSVRLSALGQTLVAFGLGVIGALLYVNFSSAESIQFSTVGLLTFIFGVALSAASIVLAISAISLGKQSESAMTRRSDESIRIQNEVFAKTIEALARIESSTGVTEKRIEDIISGRAGDMAGKLAETLIRDKGLGTPSREQLEQEIRESLLADFGKTAKAEKSNEEEEERIRGREARVQKAERYERFKNALLICAANQPDVLARKMGDGQFQAKGEDLVDGLFEKSGRILTISTFSADLDFIEDGKVVGGILQYALNVGVALGKGEFDRCYLVFDRDVDDEPEFQQITDELKLTTKDSIAESFIILSGTADHVMQLFAEDLKNWNPSDTATILPSSP